MDPVHGHLRATKEQIAAAQRMNAELAEQRAMSVTTTAGGFAVPFSLDPSVLLTSNGALNPIRQIACVVVTPFDQWKGVSSAGITASYDAEAAEVSDDSPTLAQPVIDYAMGRAFVPFSIELGMDWSTLHRNSAR